jgi:hypothetical protein
VGQAAVPRAFVSINGSDTNPCSAVQPCRSFNQALTVVEAGGEIVVQDSGGYSTGFTITQSVTIDAAGFNASVISTSPCGGGDCPGTDLCTITAAPTDRVVLRGISFHGAGFTGGNAINVTQPTNLYVDHCSISEFQGDGVRMANGGGLFVTGTDVRECEQAGLFVEGAGTTAAALVAEDSRFTRCTPHNGVGGSVPGVLLIAGTAPATGWLTNCTASFCTTGFDASSFGAFDAVLTLTNCRAFGNGAGLSATSATTGNAIISIANCVVTKNNFGIQSSGAKGAVFATTPGTNLIALNGLNGSPNSTQTLQ